MTYLSPKQKKELAYVEQFTSGKRMLQRSAKSDNTKILYARASVLFSKFMNGRGLDDLVNEYKADLEANMFKAFDKWETILDDYAAFLEGEGLGGPTVALFHSGVKALFNSNVPRSMRLQAKTPDYSTRTIVGVTIEDLKEIYDMCNDQERAYIALLKDSGISADDGLRLNFGDLRGFEIEDFVHISMIRAKEHVEYETFIGTNATQALRAYVKVRKQRGETITDNSPVFASEKTPHSRLDRRSISSLFRRVEKKTGKTISTHRLRKFFETYMALVVRHPIVLKYWMGHKIRGKGRDIEAKYIIPPTPEQLDLYRQAYKNIDLTQAGLEERVKAVEKLLETMTPEQKELMQKFGIRMSQKSRKPKAETSGKQNCEDGEHCGESFEQISETQLLTYLKQGWTIVHKLGNGDLVVKSG